MMGSRDLRIEVDWVDGDGVVTPELAATWCRLSLFVGDRCVTLVDDTKSGVRHAVYTAAYPLAEWIAYNWWSLRHEIRASAIPSHSWAWSTVHGNPWLRRHNFRGAGGGMPWPDFTVVPEGGVSRVTWRSGPGLSHQPIRFIGSGDHYLQSDQLADELARFVTQVGDRLDGIGIASPLSKEWRALSELDEDEAAFAQASARLGLDPFSMAEDAERELVSIASSLEQPLLDEFLDSADPQRMRIAFGWLAKARDRAHDASPSSNAVLDLRSPLGATGSSVRPFERGYELARGIRHKLGLAPTAKMAIGDFVSKVSVVQPAAGLEGLSSRRPSGQVVLVLPGQRLPPSAVRFAQARALGLALVTDRAECLLDPASTDLMKETRAFAAELLAPADGIRQALDTLPAATEQMFDAVAAQFNTSSWLVQLQYENQVLSH